MKKENMPAVLAGIGMLILILDTKTAILAVTSGIDLCLKVLIPSLFPFIFLSVIMTPTLANKEVRFLRPLGHLMKIPKGAETIFLIGLIGGYPVGAQCISEAIKNGSISRENGKRMLAFCSNAGPSFIFGMGSRLFPKIWMCWALWAIHIISAILVSMLFPQNTSETAHKASAKNVDVSASLQKTVHTMALICGWVILFRLLITFMEHWFLWLFPIWIQTIVVGVLELANGCSSLMNLSEIPLRFILSSAFFGFGGLCVAMQTYSVCDNQNHSYYLPGKILQGLISMLIASIIISREIALPCAIILTLLLIRIISLHLRKTKNGSIPQKSIV